MPRPSTRPRFPAPRLTLWVPILAATALSALYLAGLALVQGLFLG
ncbi:hypothetical protein [Phaeovulum vinaykumarii]|nr:hypothetical protein [Phaeovulum vinaykumarii]